MSVGWKHIVKPVKRLDDSHRRPARPIQSARSGRFEVDDEAIEMNRAEPGVCVNRDFRRYCVGEAQLVGRRDSIGKKSSFLSPRDSVDDRGVVGAARFAGQRVGAGNIVEPAVDSPDIPGKHEPLKRLVNGRSCPQIEQVVRGPDACGFVALHAVENAPPEVEARAAIRQRVLSDM